MRGFKLVGPALSLLIAGIAHATSLPTHLHFSQVIAFGDSLTDNGNGSYLLTDKAWPADPAYFKCVLEHSLSPSELLLTFFDLQWTLFKWTNIGGTLESLAPSQSDRSRLWRSHRQQFESTRIHRS